MIIYDDGEKQITHDDEALFSNFDEETALRIKEWLLTETKQCSGCKKYIPIEKYNNHGNYCNSCRNKKAQSTPEGKKKEQLRKMFRNALTCKDCSNLKHYDEICRISGITPEQLKSYLNSTYVVLYGIEPDSDYKGIHISHKKPLANATTIEQVEQCYDYKNLYLSNEKDNLSRGAKSNDLRIGEYV